MQSTPVPERFRPLLDATAELAERFTKADRTLYLVGGSVRDALYPMGAGAAAEQAMERLPGYAEAMAQILRGLPDFGKLPGGGISITPVP